MKNLQALAALLLSDTKLSSASVSKLTAPQQHSAAKETINKEMIARFDILRETDAGREKNTTSFPDSIVRRKMQKRKPLNVRISDNARNKL